jgi:F-type H+-transporting ATPase subunit delta
MSAHTSANRYARALLDVAIDQSGPERVEQDLTSFAALLDAHANLRRVLANSTIPLSGKLGLVGALASRTKVSAPVANLLRLLAERNRLALFPEVCEAYRRRLMEHQRVIEAEITTAAPLEAGRVDALAERLTAATGRRVTMTARIDATLIGGVVTRVNSTVYDGSVATQLAKIKTSLRA